MSHRADVSRAARKKGGASTAGLPPFSTLFSSSSRQGPALPKDGYMTYCFGPMMGPSPMTKYPGGAVPFCSQYARAAAACAATLATEAFD